MTLQIHVTGPVYEPTGYSQLCRRLALGLTNAGVRVTITPMRWGNTPDAVQGDQKNRLLSMIGENPRADATIHIGPPVLFPRTAPGKRVVYTMLESDRIPRDWVQACEGFDEVWVPTGFNRSSFERSGVHAAKLVEMPLGVDTALFNEPPAGTRPHRPFVFLSIFEWIPRKGYQWLIPAFAARFAGKNAVLTLKVQRNDRYDPHGTVIQNEIKQLCDQAGFPEAIRQIRVISKILSDFELARLYQECDCFVLPTSGEGWCFPAVEAAASGMPVIITGWSGPASFFPDSWTDFIAVRQLIPVPTGEGAHPGIYAGSAWALPDAAGLAQAMCKVFEEPLEALVRGQNLRRFITSRYSWEQSIERMILRLQQSVTRHRPSGVWPGKKRWDGRK